MTFLAFALFLIAATAALIIWPVLRHATLPRQKKTGLAIAVVLIVAGGGILLYLMVGIPQLSSF